MTHSCETDMTDFENVENGERAGSREPFLFSLQLTLCLKSINLLEVFYMSYFTSKSSSAVLNAKLHSAGHLIGHAMIKLGLNWQKAKSYHFPDAPYKEFIAPEDFDWVAVSRFDSSSLHFLPFRWIKL